MTEENSLEKLMEDVDMFCEVREEDKDKGYAVIVMVSKDKSPLKQGMVTALSTALHSYEAWAPGFDDRVALFSVVRKYPYSRDREEVVEFEMALEKVMERAVETLKEQGSISPDYKLSPVNFFYFDYPAETTDAENKPIKITPDGFSKVMQYLLECIHPEDTVTVKKYE
ncbi:hypothetical protein KY317_04265 [Candidatus Woesearchaeota archaeon]|nr:hypothetical protein [Candidatus Woesearchaeota archaeon]